MSLEHFNLPALLVWYDAVKRDLPWRHTTEAYKIWISEIMLQQTQVATVLPRYAQWLATFPTVSTLANANEDQVMKAWEGLGYYRRARYAHQAAKHIMQQHSGIFPHHFDAVLALPGIGRSTAGAIVSFAFGGVYPVLDGNVKRVLHRYYGESSHAAQWQQAETMVQASGNAGLWNQAMMELGATCCHRRQPLCADCPMQQHCQAAFQKELPSPVKNKIKVRDLHWQVQLYTDQQKKEIWLTRRSNHGIWGGLWSPPIITLEKQPNEQPNLIHLLTHRRLHLYGNFMQKPPPPDQGQWFTQTSLPALPTGIQRLLALMIENKTE